MTFISWSRERGKLILRTYFLLTIFTKPFIVDVWHRGWLNKPWIFNMSGFWIYRGSEYTRILIVISDCGSMFLILNMLGFWIYHGSKYVKVTQVFEYAWIIPRYAWLYLNVSKSLWMAFALHLPNVILI